MRTANAVTHDMSSSISKLGRADFFRGVVLALTTPCRMSRTTTVIEIVGTPTEENRYCGLR
jgi:hypothetical protein